MIYAIIGYDHRGCEHRYKNLKRVLAYYEVEPLVQIVLVTNIGSEVEAWNIQGVDIVQHEQRGEYSHNETVLVGLQKVPNKSYVAHMDADIIFKDGSLSLALEHLSESPVVSPLGAMENLDSDGNVIDTCIPVGNIVTTKELLRDLIEESGGASVRGWGQEDVARLIAAKKMGYHAKRYNVSTQHLWHPEASRENTNSVLENALQSLDETSLDETLLDEYAFRSKPLETVQSTQHYYSAMRGLDSLQYLSQVCDSDVPIEIHVLSNGNNDYLAQVHYAGLVIHNDNIPCEKCARSDEVGEIIWARHVEIAEFMGSTPNNILLNLWYATVANGWNKESAEAAIYLAFGNNVQVQELEQLAAKGIGLALDA